MEAPADDPKGRSIITVAGMWSASVDNWYKCALDARSKVEAIVGKDSVAAAEQSIPVCSSSSSNNLLTAEEQEWLAAWTRNHTEHSGQRWTALQPPKGNWGE